MSKKKKTSGDVVEGRRLTLAEMVAEREGQSPRSGKNRAAVLALQPDIEATLARGFSVKAIYNTLVDSGWAPLKVHGYSDTAIGELDMTYETFRNMCNDLGLKKTPSRTRSKAGRAARGKR